MKYLSKTCVCNTADMNALFMDGIVCLSPCVSIAAVVLLGELQSQWSSGQPLLPSVLCVSHMLPVCISPARETGSWTLRLHRYLIFKDFMVVFVLFSMIIEVYTSVTCFFFPPRSQSPTLSHMCGRGHPFPAGGSVDRHDISQRVADVPLRFTFLSGYRGGSHNGCPAQPGHHRHL